MRKKRKLKYNIKMVKMTKTNSIVIIFCPSSHVWGREREEREGEEGRDSNLPKTDQEHWQFSSAHSFAHNNLIKPSGPPSPTFHL